MIQFLPVSIADKQIAGDDHSCAHLGYEQREMLDLFFENTEFYLSEKEIKMGLSARASAR